MPWETLGAPSAIFELPGNKECADCKAYGPNWASWNLGILVCTTCSGVHRHLGVHISKVKSATMDKWKEEQALPCLTIGNERSNAYYEYNVPAGAKYICKSQAAAGDKIDPVEARKMERWIRAKYETKKYAQPGVDPPHVRLARGESLTGGAETQAKQEKTEEVDASPLSEKSDKDRKEKKEKKEKKDSRKEVQEGKKDKKKNAEDSPSKSSPKKESKSKSHEAFVEAEASFAALGSWAADASASASPERKERKKSRKKRLASSTAEDAGFNTGEGSPFSPPVSSPEHQAHPDGAFGGAGYDVQTAGYAGYDLGQASQGYPNGHTAAWADSGVSQMEPSLEAADTSSERRAALQTLAGLFVQPDSFVPGGVELCAPHGFDLQAAEFNPFALARPRHGAGAEPGPAAGWLHPSEPGGFGTADISAVSGWNGSLPTARTAAGESAEKDGGREEIERLQAELGNLREMMAELRKDQQQVKEHQETLGTTLSSLKDKDREDEVLEWWEASPGPSPASRLTRPEPTEVAAGPLQIHGQIEKILTLLQRQQEQQQVLLRSQRKLESKQHQLYTPSPASPGTAADFTWATQAASETASPSVPDEPPGGPWEIDATAFGDYAATFARLDFNQDGFVEGVDARSHFDHSGLQPVDLAQIWALADAGRDGRLSLAEFAVAATLVDRRSKGAELPPFLPPSLFGSASQLAEVSWEVTPEEREGLQQLFLSAPRDGGFLAAAEAGQILERSQLPRSELSQIWTLSDVDGDGRLRFGEFMCAMTLAERRRQGAALPSLLPVALQALSLARCPEEPVEDLPSTGPQVAGADVRDRRDRRLEEESIGAMKPAGSDDALWEPSTEELGDYKQLFLRLVGDADALLGAQGGKEVLERSGLPLTELAAIWYLADVDGDGQLALCEFACAMHLTARRRAGAVLPEELPSPLTRLVAGAVQFPEIANPLPAEDDSRWAIDPELLNQYRQIFDGIERRHADSLSAVEAQEVLQRSRLPNQELEAIWQLSDVDQDGELCFEEFACAIHLASLRREGEELPSQLPQALAASLANSTGGDSTDIWSLDSVELQRYSELFASLPRQGDVLAAEDAKEVLERSGLPTEELRQIWRLADRDGDGALDAGEFALAAALADRRRQGYSLPDVLPPEMLQAIGFGGASDWAMAAEDLQRYRDIFQGLPLQRDGHLRTRDAWQVLERSGLPTEELSAVLRLVGDKDGALTFSQFACALHLLARRRAGALLPSSLPEELAALGDRSTPVRRAKGDSVG